MSKFTLSTNANNRTVGTTQSVTTTSANYALSSLGVIANTVRLANTGTVGLYYAFDDVAVIATTNDVFLPAGAVEFVNVPDSMIISRNVGFIVASGSTGLNISIGTEV
jgi:hypothetical protein